MTNPTDEISLGLRHLQEALGLYLAEKTLPSLTNILDNEPTRLTLLGKKFRLSAFERLIILFCAGLELEPIFLTLCGQIQGNDRANYVTLGLVLSVFPNAEWSVLSPQNPLHYWQLIHTEPQRIFTHSPLQIDRRILCYLLGEIARSPQLTNWLEPLSTEHHLDTFPPSYQNVLEQIVTAWSTTDQPKLPIIILSGIDGMTQRNLAIAVCQELEFQLMALSVAALPHQLEELKIWQRHWEREAILSNSVLLLEADTFTTPEPAQKMAIALLLETLNTPVIFSTNEAKISLRCPAIALEIPPLLHQEQTDLWHEQLGLTELNGDVDALVTQFQLTPSAIRTVCRQFQQKSFSTVQAHEKTTHLETAAKDHLWQLCRLHARPNLDALAQRLETRATWEELVLPDRPRQLLEDIATRLKYRAQIYQDWGFAQKGDRGLGISALFHGDSGTGKTMAAEVLAQVCQLDLYRIDLSSVVSKYIGETEKNLRQIFDAAEAGGVILLFDEADALFGKRTEVKDSHDRHANIEVSYLLQRMETYRGLAILTSNFKQNLDQAFLRRLQFIVPFPFPDAGDRHKIWQHIFPDQTPCQNLDYHKLGQLKVAGGIIRSIALNAAFLAAQDHSPITMAHIRQAAQRDYTKLEKLLTTEELKGWTENP